MMGGSAGRPEPRNNRELRVENNIGYCEDALREISRTADIEFYDNSSSVPGAVVFSVTGHSDKLGEVEFMVIANESDGHRVSDHRALEAFQLSRVIRSAVLSGGTEHFDVCRGGRVHDHRRKWLSRRFVRKSDTDSGNDRIQRIK